MSVSIVLFCSSLGPFIGPFCSFEGLCIALFLTREQTSEKPLPRTSFQLLLAPESGGGGGAAAAAGGGGGGGGLGGGEGGGSGGGGGGDVDAGLFGGLGKSITSLFSGASSSASSPPRRRAVARSTSEDDGLGELGGGGARGADSMYL
jgi:hypothetical protein